MKCKSCNKELEYEELIQEEDYRYWGTDDYDDSGRKDVCPYCDTENCLPVKVKI